MIDLLLWYGLSNAAVALVLAGVAWAVHAWGRRPALAHLLWLVVLVKLITPPIVSLPVVAIPQWSASAETTSRAPMVELPAEAEPAGLMAFDPAATFETSDLAAVPRLGNAIEPVLATTPEFAPAPESAASPWSARWSVAKVALVLIWLLGSFGVLMYTLVRVVCFNRLLKRGTDIAPANVQRLAERVGRQLELRHIPAIYTTAARLSPMVWWVGGPVRVVLPEGLAAQCVPGQLRWVLAHELAHVRRRDYLVRWVEWLACVAFWWNPAAWWARRNLRTNEEVCCDALVLARFSNNNDTPTFYADAILSVVESLALPSHRPPAIASEINSGGTLERRFDMILSSKTLTKTPRWASTLMLLAAVGLMPLGLAQAGDLAVKQDRRPQRDLDGDSHRDRLADVDAGELTPEMRRVKDATVVAWLTEDGEGEMWVEWVAPADANQAVADEDIDLAAYFAQLGVGQEEFDWMVALLAGHGVGQLQLEATMGGLFHTVLAIWEHGEAAAMETLDENAFFSQHVGLDETQIALVAGLAQQIAAGLGEGESGEDQAESPEYELRDYYFAMGVDTEGYDRIVAALDGSGVGVVQMEPTLGGLIHTVLAIREQGVDAAMANIDLEHFFSEHVGLDADQIELVGWLAQRIAAGLEQGEAGEGHQRGELERPRDIERAAQRVTDINREVLIALRWAEIEAELEAGDLTVEQARAYREALHRYEAEASESGEGRGR